MKQTYPYKDDGSVFPPLVVNDVFLIHPDRNDSRTKVLPGKIDTGSTNSVIPSSLANEWQLDTVDLWTAKDIYGKERTVYSHQIRIKIDDLIDTIIEVGAMERKDLVIGRDVLRLLKLVADGTKQEFSLESAS